MGLDFRSGLIAGFLVAFAACTSVGFNYEHYGLKMAAPCWADAVALGPDEGKDKNLGQLCNAPTTGFGAGECTVFRDEVFNQLVEDKITCEERLKACENGQ